MNRVLHLNVFLNEYFKEIYFEEQKYAFNKVCLDIDHEKFYKENFSCGVSEFLKGKIPTYLHMAHREAAKLNLWV